jgi:beta-glucosidase
MSRIDDLLTQMTLDEKISLLAGADLWCSVAIPRLGIPQVKVTDGPNGARGASGSMAPPSVATPVGVALGATWNPDLVREVGGVLADEVKMKGAHILLAPTVNIHRSPIAGRNFECYSEDPFLSGTMAAAYIQGIQQNGAGACIKHFVANDQEHERHSISAEVDERTLREIYLEPFRIAIRNANPWAVMSAYNRVNGVYACENYHTLLEILKGEWGFEGIVMSDWFGTYDAGVPGGGLDLEMPGPGRWMSAKYVKAALKKKSGPGSLTEQALDDKVRRLLLVLEKAGCFENPILTPEGGKNRASHRKIIRKAAGEAIVLLKNEGLLPLRKVESIAVIGPHAAVAQILGGGSSSVNPHYATSPYEGIKKHAKKVKVRTTPGCHIYKRLPPPTEGILLTPTGEPGLLFDIFNNSELAGDPVYTEVTNRTQYGWFSDSIPNANQNAFSVRLAGSFIPHESGLHTFELDTNGWADLYLDGKHIIHHASPETSYHKERTAVKLEAGKSVELKIEYFWQGEGHHRSLSFGHMPPQPADTIGEAVRLAKKSEAVVIIVGLNDQWESEGFDRVNMKLPGEQDVLIERVCKANPNTIVVLNAGSPLEMPWIDQVPAVIQLWYDSQEQGNALADVLFGDVNPSGKLPITFPVRLEENPTYINFPGEKGIVRYGEGIFVGYRYYDKKRIEPQFPFGHGLSYTSFEYKNLRINADQFHLGETLVVEVDVKNTGNVTGKEIVQLYVHDQEASIARPEKELKAFSKISIKPGQTKTVKFSLDREAFWFYDVVQKDWAIEKGLFEIQVGASSRDIRLRKVVEVVDQPIEDHTP